jgi:glycosyltransferase involved in cell wall biosynthesis
MSEQTESKKYLPGRIQDKVNGPLVSVVTPFYNTVDYLEECVQSVLGQTYQTWEYILTDNCSTDGSGEIAEKYAMIDSRVRFFREVEFLGQVENYNRALGYISPGSKYCKIVQADDWIYPNCLAEMVSVAESGGNVGLVSSFSLYEDGPAHGGLAIALGPVYSGRDAARAELMGKALFGSPTCVMYLSDIVRSRTDFFSTTTPYFEDAEVCFEILRNHDFGFVPQILTFNRRDNYSYWSKLESHSPRVLLELMFIHRFGEYFFEPREFGRRTREIENVFYGLLAGSALRAQGKDFWRFHSEGLSWLGRKMSIRKIALEVVLRLMNSALNPKLGFEELWRVVRGKVAGILRRD